MDKGGVGRSKGGALIRGGECNMCKPSGKLYNSKGVREKGEAVVADHGISKRRWVSYHTAMIGQAGMLRRAGAAVGSEGRGFVWALSGLTSRKQSAG